jgi:hypothetical protein
MPLSKSDLDHMGKQASRAYLQEGTPLNQSITKIALEHGLNDLQTQRVCEFANLHTFESKRQEQLRGSKQAGAGRGTPNLYVQFPVADFRQVLQQKSASLNTRKLAAPKLQVPPEFYEGVPAEFRTKTLPGDTFLQTKTASEEEITVDCSQDARREVDLLVDLIPLDREKLAEAEIERVQAEDKVYHIVRNMVLEGSVKVADVIRAVLSKTAASQCPVPRDQLKSILVPIVARLEGEGVTSIAKLGMAVDPEKYITEQWDMGGAPPARIINGSHPLFAAIQDYGLCEENVRRHGTALTVNAEKLRMAKRKLSDSPEEYAKR